MSTTAEASSIQAFITKWELSGAAERANAHLFLTDLCELLGIPAPEPKGPIENTNTYHVLGSSQIHERGRG